jgi:deoxycytidylate deaminase
MAKQITEKILDSGVLRTMTKEEYENYTAITNLMQTENSAKKNSEQAKEIAIAKLVSLGLTEQDIKAMGI